MMRLRKPNRLLVIKPLTNRKKVHKKKKIENKKDQRP